LDQSPAACPNIEAGIGTARMSQKWTKWIYFYILFCRLAGPLFDEVSRLMGGEQLPLNALNMLAIDDFNGLCQNGGIIFIVAPI
jgi:hypothetical protein